LSALRASTVITGGSVSTMNVPVATPLLPARSSPVVVTVVEPSKP
jgi:hypothetical protein